MSLSWKHLFGAVFTLCFVACSNQQDEVLEIVEEADVWRADTAVQEVREEDTHQMPEGWCGGSVVVEGGESVPEGTEVVVAGDGDTLRLKVDNQGRYGFVPAQTGSHTFAVEVAGFYPDQGAVSLVVGEESDLPTLTLRRWKVLQEAPGLRLGESLLDGRVFTFWTEVDALREEGKLWLYLVEEDETVLLHESASTSAQLQWGVAGTDFIVFATTVNPIDHLAEFHVYNFVSKLEISVVPDVLYEMTLHGMFHDFLVFRTSDDENWSDYKGASNKWVDIHTGFTHSFNDCTLPCVLSRSGHMLALISQTDVSGSRNMIRTHNLITGETALFLDNAYIMERNALDGLFVGDWGPEGELDGPLYYWAEPGQDPVLLEEKYLDGQLLVSKDGQAIATISGGGLFAFRGEKDWTPLHLLEVGTGLAVEEVSQAALSGSVEFSEDGRWLLFMEKHNEDAWNLIRYEWQTGEKVVIGGGPSASPAGMDPTSRFLAFTRASEGPHGFVEDLYLHSLETGEERLAATGVWRTGVSFSPDGESLAYEYVLEEVTGGSAYLNSSLAVASTGGEGLLSPAVECEAYQSVGSCKWRPDSSEVVCLCGTSYQQTELGTLTVLRPGTAESHALGESDKYPLVWFGVQGSLLAHISRPENTGALVWACAPESLEDWASRTWDGAWWLSGAEPGATFSLTWIRSEAGETSLLDMATGHAETTASPALQMGVSPEGWRFYIMEVSVGAEGSTVSYEGLLVHPITGKSVWLPGKAQLRFESQALGFSQLVWPGHSGAWGSGDIVISGFDAASGQLWTLAQGDYGYLIKSPGDHCMAALDLDSQSDSTGGDWGSTYPAGNWVGSCLNPGKAVVYLASNVAVAPSAIPQGAMVYGCLPEGEAEATSLCVARIP